MSSEIDSQRIAEMGATRDRIEITGNTKFEAALGRLPEEREIAVDTFACERASTVPLSKDAISGSRFGFPAGKPNREVHTKVLERGVRGGTFLQKRSLPAISSSSRRWAWVVSEMVLVAGSVHPGEYEIVLDAYKMLAERFP